jgi:hypothetical protein
MASVQFNRISVGAHHLDTQEIFPVHKRKVEEYLSKIFQENAGELPSKKTPFEVQFNPGRPTFRVGEDEKVLESSRELKRVGRVVRYYQHTGYLPRQQPLAKDVAEGEVETRKSIRALNDASLPGSNGSILAGMRLADDTLSLTRNILFAIPDIGPQDPVVNHLGYYAGIFWTFFSLRELDEGVAEYRRSVTIGDNEGRRRAESRILSGGIVSGASVAYLAGKFCDTYASTTASAAMSAFSNVLFGVGSLVAIGASALGAVRCERFNRRLNEYIENPRLTEVQKLQGALQFLKDSISVTAEEKAELKLQVEQKHPDWSPEQKEKLLYQKLSDLTEVKVKYMKRRTSNKSLFLILTQADNLLAKLANKDTCAEGIKEASLLINTIQQESKLKMSLYMLGLVAATLSFLGMLVMSFMTAGVLPFVLYGIAGTIYLAMTIYSIGGLFIKKESDNKPIEMPSVPNLTYIS